MIARLRRRSPPADLVHDYLFTADVVRLAFVLGVITSVLLYERRHVTTGSIVVPGYIAVFLLQPIVLATTALVAGIAYWFVNRLLTRWVLLYGRVKFTALVLVSMVLQILLLKTTPETAWLWESSAPLVVAAGYVVPALIAHDMGRQGIKKTLAAVAASGAIVAIPLAALVLAMPSLTADAQLVGFDVLAFPPAWVPVAVLVSAVTSWALMHNFSLRAGGFIGAAYLAMLMADLRSVAFLLVIGIATWAFVVSVLEPRLILFGRRKFAAMMLMSAIMAWGGTRLFGGMLGFEFAAYQSVAGVTLTPLFVPGLIANDIHRSSPIRVVAGVTLGATFTAATTWTVAGVFGVAPAFDLTLPAVVGLAALSGAAVFGPQIMNLGARVMSRVRAWAGQPEASV